MCLRVVLMESIYTGTLGMVDHSVYILPQFWEVLFKNFFNYGFFITFVFLRLGNLIFRTLLHFNSSHGFLTANHFH